MLRVEQEGCFSFRSLELGAFCASVISNIFKWKHNLGFSAPKQPQKLQDSCYKSEREMHEKTVLLEKYERLQSTIYAAKINIFLLCLHECKSRWISFGNLPSADLRCMSFCPRSD